jgi:predicted RNA-binding protein YlqC (UPF0109 family)
MTDTEKASASLEHLLKPILSYPDAMTLNVIQGNATIIVELAVHGDDHAYLSDEENQILQSLKQLLAVTRFERKVVIELLAPVEA